MLFCITTVMLPLSVQAYVGAGLGIAFTDSEHSYTKIFAGYHFIPNFAIELAYSDFGNYHGERADAYSLSAVATVPVDDTWDLFAKFGVTENHTKFAESTNHVDMLTGIGFVYKATQDVSLRFGYENYGKMMNDGSAINNDVTAWGINLTTSY